MSELLGEVTRLARAGDRARAAAALGSMLGGEGAVLFVRDPGAGVFLPAPGFPQTLPNARAWRLLLAAAVGAGEASADALEQPHGSPKPVFAIAAGSDAALVIVGARARPALADEVRRLLPFLEEIVRGERVVEQAVARERVAEQSAAHAERLAAAFDSSRVELQQALTAAERARDELAQANEQLGQQAEEMEAQAEELSAQAEELQAINAQLEAARGAAEAANQAKSDFLATMSHELRTPLNAISGHTQLIEMGIYGPVTPEQRQALGRIERSQRHLLGLINDILNLAKIEAGRVEYRMSDLRLAEVFTDIAPMIEPQIRSKRLSYRVGVADDGVVVRADKEKLEQILINLLSNAIKFTPEGGAIELRGGPTPGHPSTADIEVTDTGIGIPADKINGIFEPFVQVMTGHSRPNEGTGLGLSISRELARGMGGDLGVSSSEGDGSTFRLRLLAAGGLDAIRG